MCRTDVFLEAEDFSAGGPVFLNLHENEQTSVGPVRNVLRANPGRLVCMRSRGRRNVVFWQRLIPHVFDPNRIFTDAGLRETLSDYSSLTASALAALQLLRGEVLTLLRLPHGQPVVALHNNDGIGYSVVEYLAGGRHTDDAAAVAAPAMQRPEDFFLVTDPRWFARLEVPVSTW